MDFWFVAAVAGAGYVAQRLKNIKNSKLGLHSSECLNLVKPDAPSITPTLQEKQCPLFSEIFQKCDFTKRELACQYGSHLSDEFDGEILDSDKFMTRDTSNSNCLDVVEGNGDTEGELKGKLFTDIKEVTFDPLPQSSSRNIGFSYNFGRNINCIKSRQINRKFVKPQTSLESCLMAQLFNERAEMEEYVCSVYRSHGSPLGSILHTDKNHQESSDVLGEEISAVLGVPRLPIIVNGELQTKDKVKTGKKNTLKMVNSSSIVNGSSSPSLKFYLGLTMGMVSSFLANKREMENLVMLLKHTENLVRDLQDELEMKDSLTVKELTLEDSDSGKERCDLQCEEQSSLSKIEEELEAELERLESNMYTARWEGKITNLTEVDPDFGPDVLFRDMKIDLFDERENYSPPLPTEQYPISPRELSLRLHDVIQSRLEERVMELETALQNSHGKVKWPDRELSNSTTTSSYLGSPVTEDNHRSTDERYIEASRSGKYFPDGHHQEILFQCKPDDDSILDRDLYSYTERHLNPNRYVETEFSCRKEETHEIPIDVLCGQSVSDDSDDEKERLLITQIVEQARKGSPVFIQAQKELFSTD